MDVAELFESLPYVADLGVEMESAADGEAVGHLDLQERHSSIPGRVVAHGGVTYALADTVAGAAVFSLHHTPTPTVDMRIDYLAPGRGTLTATAELVRDGGSVAVVAVDVTDADGEAVADARGVFKTGRPEGDTAWASSEQIDGMAGGMD